MVLGNLWAGDDPGMTECLECSLTRLVLAQSWESDRADGAWYSTTALPSGRDRPQNLCDLGWRGSEPKTRWTEEWRPLQQQPPRGACW